MNLTLCTYIYFSRVIFIIFYYASFVNIYLMLILHCLPVRNCLSCMYLYVTLTSPVSGVGPVGDHLNKKNKNSLYLADTIANWALTVQQSIETFI